METHDNSKSWWWICINFSGHIENNKKKKESKCGKHRPYTFLLFYFFWFLYYTLLNHPVRLWSVEMTSVARRPLNAIYLWRCGLFDLPVQIMFIVCWRTVPVFLVFLYSSFQHSVECEALIGAWFVLVFLHWHFWNSSQLLASVCVE
jgi:hypothetical protein